MMKKKMKKKQKKIISCEGWVEYNNKKKQNHKIQFHFIVS